MSRRLPRGSVRFGRAALVASVVGAIMAASVMGLTSAAAAACDGPGTETPCALVTSIVDASGRPVTTVAVGAEVHPQVTLTAPTTPTGTVVFAWFANGTCEGPAVATSPAFALDGGRVDATRFTQIPRKVGAYAFLAQYSGDAAHPAAAGDCRMLTVTKAPQVLGSSASIAITAGESVAVGDATAFEVLLTITGDTTLTGVTVVETFENAFLVPADPLPHGCTVQTASPDRQQDSIVCTIGTVPLSVPARTVTRSFHLPFHAVGGTGSGTTTHSAYATFKFEGGAQSPPVVIGPATAKVKIAEAPRVTLPDETSGTQGEEIAVPVRLTADAMRVPTTFTFTLIYDPNLLRLNAVSRGSLASPDGPRWTVRAPGLVDVSVVSLSGTAVNSSPGALVFALFTVLAGNGQGTISVADVRAVAVQTGAAPLAIAGGSGRFTITPLAAPAPEPPPAPRDELPQLWDPRLWTPGHVAASLGYSAVLGVSLTLLAEIFNGTIEENRNHFPGWWRRRRLQVIGSREPRSGPGEVEAGDATVRSAVSMVLLAAVYLLLGSVLFAFLRPEEVAENPRAALAAACFALVATTSASQLPRWVYVRYLNRSGALHPLAKGHRLIELRADFWTLAFACVCVLLAYRTGVRPGYAYGIIGVLSVNKYLTLKADRDRGQLQPWRMDLAGMTCLFVVALACWLTYSAMHADHHDLVPRLLEEAWALGSETVALGLIPLSFLPGRSLWHWNRPGWAGLWGLGLFLYIQSITPTELGAGPLTIALTLVGYAAVTAGFWWYFRYAHDEASCDSCRAAEPELAGASLTPS